MSQKYDDREKRRQHLEEVMEDHEEREARKPKIGISKRKGMWMLIIGFIAYGIITWGVRGQRFQDIIDTFRSFTGG